MTKDHGTALLNSPRPRRVLALTQSGLDGWAGVQGAQNCQGFDCGKRQFWGDVGRYGGQSKNSDIEHFAGGLY